MWKLWGGDKIVITAKAACSDGGSYGLLIYYPDIEGYVVKRAMVIESYNMKQYCYDDIGPTATPIPNFAMNEWFDVDPSTQYGVFAYASNESKGCGFRVKYELVKN